jgi:hypothetical protein
VRDILAPIIDEAVNWKSLGFPLRCLKIVEYEKSPGDGEAAAVFAEVKKKHSRWHAFISYSHQDSAEAGTGRLQLVYSHTRHRSIQLMRAALRADSAKVLSRALTRLSIRCPPDVVAI